MGKTAYGAINSLESQIPSGGTAGQVWTSNGSGAGKWADAPSGKKSLYTGPIRDLIIINSDYVEIAKEFDIEYIQLFSGNTNCTRTTISKGLWSGTSFWFGVTNNLGSGSGAPCHIYIWHGSLEVNVAGGYQSDIGNQLTTESTEGLDDNTFWYRLYV